MALKFLAIMRFARAMQLATQPKLEFASHKQQISLTCWSHVRLLGLDSNTNRDGS